LVENFNINIENKTVLVAPLDWGLGHATRCIPIINTLLAQNCNVIVAADGAIATLLKKSFPNVLFLQLQGYNIKYSKTKIGLPLKMLSQLSKILAAIKAENTWLEKVINEYKIDIVISDNRAGLHSSKVKCIYITHQLTIKAGNKFLERWMQKLHYKYINKFTECWVPDAEGENNLAGELSHPKIKPQTPLKFIGALSRFIKKDLPIIYDAAIVLSGPEPQRTIFENIILSQLKNIDKKMVLVRGLPNDNVTLTNLPQNILCYNFLNVEELNNVMLQSNLIVCRSGYSSIMDLEVLQKKAVLVPTPGQTEQEYLATILSTKNNYQFIGQKKFDLQKLL
jgi:uncharacterized protein (TIGR00661 family)